MNQVTVKVMKKYVWFTLSSLMLLGSSCIEQYGEDKQPTPDLQGMEALVVADGFDYEMYTDQSVSVSFNQSESGRIDNAESFQYAIIGVDFEGQLHGMQTGQANLISGIDLTIAKPLHIQSLLLYTKYIGNARFFELGQNPMTIDVAELIIDEQTFITSHGRLESVPACVSFLGNATKIHCRKNEVVLQSSASFLYVDVTFSDGAIRRYEPGDVGSVNANQNTWTFINQIEEYDLDQARFFTVYANCQTAPHTLGLELVTFSNPCASQQDSDGDGVTDDADVDPQNQNVSAVQYLPARDRYATFAFEDMWPYKGDYDFNDLVISHNATVFTNASGFVTKVNYDFVIRAIGARYQNDLCISFSDASHNLTIQSIDPSNLSYELIPLEGATEIRFAQFKSLFNTEGFVNTDTTKLFREPVQISMVLLMDGSLTNENFKIDEYLRINQEEGREVHKPGKPFTSLMDVTMLGTAADDTDVSLGKYFKTADNLPWVLEIPVEWEYPKEQVDITQGYPHFKDFAQGKSNSPWYTDADGNKVHKHLYRKQ